MSEETPQYGESAVEFCEEFIHKQLKSSKRFKKKCTLPFVRNKEITDQVIFQ